MADVRFILKAVRADFQRELAGTLRVGRGVLDGIALTVEGASRKHAVVSVENGEVFVEDTGSKNGTHVNEKRLVGKRRLEAGDRVRFHTQEFELERVEAAQDTIAVVQNDQAPRSRGVEWLDDIKFDDSDHTQQCSAEQFAEIERKSAERRLLNLAAPPVSEACLQFMRESEPNIVVALNVNGSPEQEWIVGRRLECDVHLDARGVSAVHAKILRTGAQWYAIDALSANGLFVNGFQVGKQYLSSGDAIRFGNVECVFRLPKKAAKERTGASKAGKGTAAKAAVSAAIVVVVCVALLVGWWAVRRYWLGGH